MAAEARSDRGDAAHAPTVRRSMRGAAAGAALFAAALLAGCASSPDGRLAYERFAERSVAVGLMRRDFAPADAPYSQQDLVENFRKVVFEPEAQLIEIDPSLEERTFRLSKWRGGIAYRLHGDDVRASDRAAMRTLAQRLVVFTNLDIAEAAEDAEANVGVFILTPRGRDLLSDYLDERGVPFRDTIIDRWINSLEIPCAGFLTSSRRANGEIVRATVLIKSEVEGVLRESCLHEEFVQSLGLTNDHPDVRPSLFNDDEEFALLTQHDGDLLRILYDERLEPGMSSEEAMPVVREIVKDVRPEG